MSLPHERERDVLDDIVDDCLKGRNKFVVVITPNRENVRFLVNEIHKIVQNLNPSDARQIMLFREGIEFDNGALVRFDSYNDPSRLAGLHPDRVVLMGNWGEFWYYIMMMQSHGAEIEAAA